MAWGYSLQQGVTGWLGRRRGSRWRGSFLLLDNRVEDTGVVLCSGLAFYPFDASPPKGSSGAETKSSTLSVRVSHPKHASDHLLCNPVCSDRR